MLMNCRIGGCDCAFLKKASQNVAFIGDNVLVGGDQILPGR